MKRNGNTAVNAVYNPKNKKPDIPLDADEVDSAMERFIRKKYQEKSLESGRPVPPARSEISPTVPPKSPDYMPATPTAPSVPAVPAKKHRFFGFGLRASSSALPLSKHDKKKLPPEPRVDSAFTISGDDYGSLSRRSHGNALSDAELSLKLTQLKDMGFHNAEANTKMLRRLNGDVERTVEALVRLGPQPAERTTSASNVIPQPTGSSRTNTSTAAAYGSESGYSGVRATHTGASNNPFDQAVGTPTFGISMDQPRATQQPQQPQPQPGAPPSLSKNPFDQPARSQTDGGLGLSQAFQGLQVNQQPQQPLFPHNTGGFVPQQPYGANDVRYQTMTPPAGMSNQQYGYSASPAPLATNSNPFFQPSVQQQPAPPLSAQATGNNPFLQLQPAQQTSVMGQAAQGQQSQTHGSLGSQNPFMGSMPSPPQQMQSSLPPNLNPFGIPPSGPDETSSQAQYRRQEQTMPQPSSDAGAQIGVPGLFGGGNPFQQQSAPSFQTYPPVLQGNPYASSGIPQHQYAQQSFGTAPMTAQPTGRIDKSSIMALYNYPTMSQSGLSSIPEPDNQQQGGPAGGSMSAKRSSTMPISMSSMHSAGGAGSMGVNRNPFLQNSAQALANTGIMSHSSRDSMMINNLENQRHSPDAFANLSARYA
jgi:hypothetical protein